MPFPRSLRSACLVLLCAVAGCGAEADPLGRKDISGTVTLDGQPLDSGTISFEPQGESKTAAGAPITNGTYTIPDSSGLAPGNYRVSVTSPEPGTDSDQNRSADDLMNNPPPPRKERIPAKYNKNTELTATVSADQPSRFDFDIKTK